MHPSGAPLNSLHEEEVLQRRQQDRGASLLATGEEDRGHHRGVHSWTDGHVHYKYFDFMRLTFTYFTNFWAVYSKSPLFYSSSSFFLLPSPSFLPTLPPLLSSPSLPSLLTFPLLPPPLLADCHPVSPRVHQEVGMQTFHQFHLQLRRQLTFTVQLPVDMETSLIHSSQKFILLLTRNSTQKTRYG